jgi:hypothetical protein
MVPSTTSRVIFFSLALSTLASCQLLKKGSDGDTSDAATTAALADGGKGAAAKDEPALPTTFELVAVGKRSGSKIVWLKKIGDRVWLSGMGIDAFADGEGPLATGSDLTSGLPQKPGEGWEYTGSGSSLLVALRATPETAKSDNPPMAWTRDGKGAWSSGAKFPHLYSYHNFVQQFGFVPWKDGALLVTGQVSMGTNMALFNPNVPGTDFETISPKGEVKQATFDLPKEVMAFGADSDGSTLSVVGYRAKNLRAVDISVFRGDDKGPLAETPIMGDPGTQDPKALSAITVREHGKVALAFITSLYYGGGALANNASTVFVIGDHAKEPKKILFAPEGKGAIPAAAYVGGSVYATVEHGGHFVLSRAAEGGTPTPVKLPSLAKAGAGFHVAKDGEAGLTCEAIDLFARKNDLWVHANCTGQGMKVPAVFRLGHAQEPIALP